MSASSPSHAQRPVLVPVAAAQWTRTRVSSCDDWTPTDDVEVVQVDRITHECFGRSPLEVTKVFTGPESDDLGDEDWRTNSTPWLDTDGHSILRRTSGQLLNLSARAVGGAMCSDCDAFVVIVGPDAPGLMDEGVQFE